MSKKDVFAIFPYLKTTQRVCLRGIVFRSSDDLEGLSNEQQIHLKTLFAMFFLRNNLRIKRMIYAHVELGEDNKVNQDHIRHLYEVQTLINYLYATPHPTMGDPFLPREQASMYVFTSDKIYTGLIWPRDPQVNDNVENVGEEELPHDKDIDGYNGMLNGVSHFWVVAGNRIYPPTPHLSLNISQDLWRNMAEFVEAEKNWAWADLLEGYEYENAELNERLFIAMDWYNRSTAKDVDEEEVLLNLAVAFEALLNLENNDKVTARFRETVMTLLGSVPRLDSWLEQFYNARSWVAHKGKAPHYMFYAVNWDKDKLSKVYSGKDTATLPYRSLTTYGWRIFRLCLSAILSGARMADDDGLSSLFVHNQERLDKLLQQLNRKSEAPEKRLLSIEKTVEDLYDHHWSSQELVQSETLIAVGKLMIETYLETKPQLSPESETLIQQTSQQLRQKEIPANEKLHLFQRIIDSLKQSEDNAITSHSRLNAQRPLAIVLSLLNYVTSPGFLTRKWRQAKNNQDPSS